VGKNHQKNHNFYSSCDIHVIFLGPLSEAEPDAHVDAQMYKFCQKVSEAVGVSMYRRIILK
jgi:hypothetical protein